MRTKGFSVGTHTPELEGYWVEFGFEFCPKCLWVGAQWRKYRSAIELTCALIPTLHFRIYIQRYQ